MRTLNWLTRGLAATALLATAFSSAAAQNNGDSRWQAWLGCWQPTMASPSDPSLAYNLDGTRAAVPTTFIVNTAAPHVCVLPSQGNSAVDILTVEKDSIVSRHHVDASGARVVVKDQGCDGWESAQWSIDNRRVYLHSELACAGGVTRKSDGILAMAANGDWLDVQSVNTGYGTAVRTMRYRDVGISAPYPAELATGLKQFQAERLAVSSARGMVGATVSPANVEDASRIVTPQVVQAWLATREQPFSLDARALQDLAKNGVPGTTTDVMIALSYPRRFALNAGAQPVESVAQYGNEGLSRSDSARIASVYTSEHATSYDPFGWGYYDYDPYGYPYGYDPYGYHPYGVAPYSAYPYYGYGAGYQYGGYYYGGAPVVVVRGADTPHGRAVNGRGYSNSGQSSSTGTAHGRSEPSNSASGASRAAAGSSNSSNNDGNSGSSSSSKGTVVGTAHKKPPV